MSENVDFKQLSRTLTALGFEETRLNGGHAIFKHTKTGAVVTLPTASKSMRPVYVSTVARQVANSGIATVSDFKRRLAGTPAKAQP